SGWLGMKWTSSIRGSMSRVTCSPLTLIETLMSGLLVKRTRGSPAQGAVSQNASQVALVVDRAAAVGLRLAVLGRDRGSLRERLVGRRAVAQQVLGARQVDRREAEGAECDPRLDDVLALDPDAGRRRGDRPVARAPLDLLVRGAHARLDREPDLGEHLRLADGRHVRADVEVGH